MDFVFTEEQRQLRSALANYLRRYPDAHGRDRFDSSLHGERWRSMSDELGLGSLALPQERGGLGGDPVDTMIVMEEFGSALVIEPFIETVVVASHLLAGSQRDLVCGDIDQIVDGTHRYTLAHFDDADGPQQTMARRDGGGWRLTGMKPMVLAAPWADRFLVSAVNPDIPDHLDQLLLFVVEPNVNGVRLESFATIDGRCAADLHFDNVLLNDNALVHAVGTAATRIEEALDAARAAQAAEAVGIMRRMLRDTIDYTKGRQQFGHSLADFQVSRHRMTDMAIQIETARSALYLGTLKLSAAPVDRARAISTMVVMVARALRLVGQNAIQLHGGMGMTDELALGHYAKRALAIEQSYGSAEWHLHRFVTMRDAA